MFLNEEYIFVVNCIHVRLPMSVLPVVDGQRTSVPVVIQDGTAQTQAEFFSWVQCLA